MGSDGFQIIILAAGEGKRMAAGKAKVLVELRGKPLLLHLLDAVIASGVDPKPIIVIAANQRGKEVKEALAGYNVEFVVQQEQLGTGHAVAACQQAVKKAKHILVLYGDQPLLRAETIRRLAKAHVDAQGIHAITLMTTTVDDFDDWRGVFNHFGRIVRDEGTKEIIGIVEYRDADSSQLEIREVNPGYMCFVASLLWELLKKLQPTNNQKEYYLTDVVAYALERDWKISSIEIEPAEALGINSPDDLQLVEKLLRD